MQSAWHVDADIIFFIRSTETKIFHRRFRVEMIGFYKIRKFYSRPPRDLVPALDAFEIETNFCLRKFFDILKSEQHRVAVFFDHIQSPRSRIKFLFQTETEISTE